MSQEENLVAVLTGKLQLSLQKRDHPAYNTEPGPTQLLIRVRSVGICGSDVHYYADGRCGPFLVDGPIVLGHESSGEVVRVGSDVQDQFKPGDRVAMEPGIPCKHCQHCKTGSYNLCKKVEFLATPPYDGSLARFILHEASFCFKLPSHVSYEAGAMLEPFSVALYTCHRASLSFAKSVLIQGAGPIGLATILAAKACGACPIIVSDVRSNRLEVAKDFGAHHVINSAETENFPQTVISLISDKVDVAIDCSGAEQAIIAAIRSTKPGGKVLLVGRGSQDLVRAPLFELADDEIDLIGVFRYRHIYGRALQLLSSGIVDLDKLITHRFGLDEVSKAFEVARKGVDENQKFAIKVAVNF